MCFVVARKEWIRRSRTESVRDDCRVRIPGSAGPYGPLRRRPRCAWGQWGSGVPQPIGRNPPVQLPVRLAPQVPKTAHWAEQTCFGCNNLRHCPMIRNQQVAGSIPAGGSMVIIFNDLMALLAARSLPQTGQKLITFSPVHSPFRINRRRPRSPQPTGPGLSGRSAYC